MYCFVKCQVVKEGYPDCKSIIGRSRSIDRSADRQFPPYYSDTAWDP